jgi:hypothetical protein
MKPENNRNILLLFAILLVFSSVMSFRGLQDSMRLVHLSTLFLIFVFLFIHNSFNRRGAFSKRYVWLFICVPWLSLIPAYVSHGQTFIQSAAVLIIETSVFMIYFLLIELEVSEKQIIKTMTVFALIYTFFELFQQISYPIYWFAGRGDSEAYSSLEKRLGMWKFYMFGIHYLVIPLFFYWQKILQKASAIRILLFAFLAIGLYAFLARKMLFAFIICIIFSLFIGKSVKWYHWTLIIIAGVAISINLDVWFGDYVEKTTADVEAGENWVRAQSTTFFLSYFDDPLCIIFGNGRENSESSYGQYLKGLAAVPFRLRRGDIGVYAHLSYYGIVGLIPLILFVLFLYRRWVYLPLYIKLYFIYHLVQVTVAFPFNSINSSSTLAIVMYLIDLNIRRRKKLEMREKPVFYDREFRALKT